MVPRARSQFINDPVESAAHVCGLLNFVLMKTLFVALWGLYPMALSMG